jgi:aryl-alcohol dehydrogenase-like predicted oxidoreductase
MMQRRPLGSTGVEVSVLSYGAMELRGGPRGRSLSEAEVADLLNRVLDSGINVIDTAIDYEESEERIGRHLAHRRDEYFLASKCGCLVGWERPVDYKGGHPGGGPHVFDRANIIAGVEQSLRRLRTSHLDLVQLHASPDVATLEEHGVLDTLAELRESGKVRFIGMSGVLPALEDHIRLRVFDVFQIPYSGVERQHEDAIHRAADSGAGVLVRGGSGRGVASGDERAITKNPKLAQAWTASGMDGLLEGMPAMEFMLRFSLSHPGVSSVLVGTANPEHLDANVDAIVKGPLPHDLYRVALGRMPR